MKKIKILSKIIPFIGMMALISIGCTETSDTEPHPTGVESAQPLETADMSTSESMASDVEDEKEEEDKPKPEQQDHRKWQYDKKNKRLTLFKK